ncbi:MAG: RNA polymerase sigma factor [Flavobacteriaceae bacterium]|nr:RNA polymerase sigma factor [Flavobacteriaceae bacterium]
MTTNYKDEELINSILRGEAQSYSLFIERYKNMAFSLALKTLEHREEAEEVAQDSFIKAFKAIHTFKGESKLSTWFYKIVYHSCLDRIKKNRKKFLTESIENKFDISDSSALNALDLMDRDDLQLSVKHCLDLMSPDDSFILSLYYLEEQSLEEISTIMEITPNNAKVKLFRARNRLNTIFKNNLEPEFLERYESTR